MRRKYYILWLDDAFSKSSDGGDSVYYYKKKVENHLENLGYIPDIIPVSNKDEAESELQKNKKVDLFISDYNIDEEYKGIDFLKLARMQYLQEMILYSNVSVSDIKQYVIKNLEEETLELEFLSNFIFQSASNMKMLINTINETIDLTLIRWNELNALRGFYLAETSQIHEELKSYIKNHADYSNIISTLQKNRRKNWKLCNDLICKIQNNNLTVDKLELYEVQLMLFEYDDDIFDLFDEIRSLRNGFAHVKELEDLSGNAYIELKDGTKIYENDIINKRKLLFDFSEKVSNKYLAQVGVN